jgi:hypothetical protein
LAAQGAKPQEFESPNTRMRFRFISGNFQVSLVTALAVCADTRR